ARLPHFFGPRLVRTWAISLLIMRLPENAFGWHQQLLVGRVAGPPLRLFVFFYKACIHSGEVPRSGVISSAAKT
ncbi:MAG: hypothetical protein VX763_00990, partial [Actinomycetota bacterium]|nr:hypothetical protein [Actinomycetota bacterium]